MDRPLIQGPGDGETILRSNAHLAMALIPTSTLAWSLPRSTVHSVPESEENGMRARKAYEAKTR